MRFTTKLALGLVMLTGLAGVATAQTRIVFVTHGQSADPYWSVVKNGMDDAAKALGVEAEYLHPITRPSTARLRRR
jgi:simple sugar transport system substrate-binding protein